MSRTIVRQKAADPLVVNVHEEALEHAKFTEVAGRKVSMKIPLGTYMHVARKRNRQVNPIAPNQADIVNWILWDKATTAAAATTSARYSMFTVAQGGTKTKVDTNLQVATKLQSPQWFNTFNVAVHTGGNMDKVDLDALYNNYYLEFWVGDKVYIEGPIFCFPGGVGLNGSAATTVAATTLQNYTNGVPLAGNMYDLRLPAGLNLGGNMTDGLMGITILQDQPFHVDIAGTAFALAAAPAPGLLLWTLGYGILSRQVQ